MIHCKLQVSLLRFLLLNLVLHHFDAQVTSQHGPRSLQPDKGGALNPSNSTRLASTQSNSQGNRSATTTGSNSQTHLAPNAAANSSSSPAARVAPKLVFAHFMAGLTYDYTQKDWLDEISLAASHGIDAFAVNVGLPDSWQVNQVSTAYRIAAQVKVTTGQPFKLFLSLDMSVIQTTDQVRIWLSKLSQHESQLLVDGKVFISTFSGEHTLFGASNLTAGWTAAIKTPLAALNPPMEPLFVPVWSGLDPTTAVSANPIVDGIMTWKAWPTGTETTNTKVDLQFQADSKKNNKYYMAAVSPSFFTHYSDKNFMFRSDDNLYLNRWKDLIAMPSQPDFIQIISWNDYGESHYIGRQIGTPPNGTTWIQGLDHLAWLDMSDYFIQWYKTGSPSTITEDKVYYSYRPHSVTATASSDPLGPPTDASTTTDAIYLAAFITANSSAQKVKVTIGKTTQTFSQLNLGSISTFSMPWNGASGAVQVELLDGSDKPLLVSKAQNPINNSIEKYNFNYASEVLMARNLKNDPKSKAHSGCSNIANLLKPWTIFLAISIVLFSNFV